VQSGVITETVVPAALAAKVRPGARVLITDGTRDTNIPTSTIGPLATAAQEAGATGPGLVVLQGTDHLLHLPGQSQNDPTIAPAAVAAIEEWAQPYATAP